MSYKHHSLPKRSDPTYGKLYRELCKEELKTKSRKKYREKVEANPNWQKENYARIKDKATEYRKLNKQEFAERQWKHRGIIDFSYERYLIELKVQQNLCAICQMEMDKPHVDHDHKTGKFRGLLCASCNLGLGIYERRKEEFEKYLMEAL